MECQTMRKAVHLLPDSSTHGDATIDWRIVHRQNFTSLVHSTLVEWSSHHRTNITKPLDRTRVALKKHGMYSQIIWITQPDQIIPNKRKERKMQTTFSLFIV